MVMRSTGSWYEVLRDGATVRCRIRGKLRLKGARSTNPVAVGDNVRCEADEQGGYAIAEILPRRNYMIRRASNLSKESHVTCEAYKIPVTILLAKADLARTRPEAAAEFRRVYEGAGYRVMEVSATEGDGIDEVRELLRGRTTLLSGNSGVGKSTLAAAVEEGLDIRTGEISQSHHKGRHTTTYATMYPLSGGGYIIDTPGIKGFGLLDIDDAELAHYFPEMMRYLPECRFYNCSHTHEPHCAVVSAVERGEIAYSRYESYLKILDEDDKYRK